MANGMVKPISEVKAGDYVLTAEPGKKKKESHRVKQVIVTKTDRNYVDVIVDTKAGPKTIQTTKHHQFYEASRNAWTQAGDLKAGHELQNGDGAPTRIVEVKSYTAQRVTYDLSIEDLHTYYVVAGPSAVLVHNARPGPDGSCQLPLFVLGDGETSSAAQRAASLPGGGTRVGQAAVRQQLIDSVPDGESFQCWRCGMETDNPDNLHLGHKNVPTSKGGNLAPENVCLEGAACNLSANNRGGVKPGRSCAERGSCGAPYRRKD
ncbi:Hint domain-containing protein [Streptomyces sp. NL15-2K]|uniref:Hint domain-containing protein n=1 Tax=Streptomyces sp. NL15-2K TaxID=376149 RepID=UPI000F5812B6|nr:MULTISPECIES: Hint domain-containing protein [Actinomycetes]WKX09799.1 Hint domain-containing protein [Kutzneria buriramensis]